VSYSLGFSETSRLLMGSKMSKYKERRGTFSGNLAIMMSDLFSDTSVKLCYFKYDVYVGRGDPYPGCRPGTEFYHHYIVIGARSHHSGAPPVTGYTFERNRSEEHQATTSDVSLFRCPLRGLTKYGSTELMSLE